MLDKNDKTNDIRLQDLFDELEFKQRPSKKLISSCMFALRDTYVKETETSFTLTCRAVEPSGPLVRSSGFKCFFK
jgi:hypothetical protein